MRVVRAILRAETATLGSSAQMQIAPEQGAFMAMLVRLMGAVRLDAAAVQIVGTFTLPMSRVGALTKELEQLAAHP